MEGTSGWNKDQRRRLPLDAVQPFSGLVADVEHVRRDVDARTAEVEVVQIGRVVHEQRVRAGQQVVEFVITIFVGQRRGDDVAVLVFERNLDVA